jgi:hypothetical protein
MNIKGPNTIPWENALITKLLQSWYSFGLYVLICFFGIFFHDVFFLLLFDIHFWTRALKIIECKPVGHHSVWVTSLAVQDWTEKYRYLTKKLRFLSYKLRESLIDNIFCRNTWKKLCSVEFTCTHFIQPLVSVIA